MWKLKSAMHIEITRDNHKEEGPWKKGKTSKAEGLLWSSAYYKFGDTEITERPVRIKLLTNLRNLLFFLSDFHTYQGNGKNGGAIVSQG